jgi:hypothetical protein
MKFYLQLDENNIIRDAIEYPFGNYIEYETEYPLPVGVLEGWFKLEGGKIVEYPELKPSAPLEKRFDALEEQHAEYLLDLDLRLSMLELGLM